MGGGLGFEELAIVFCFRVGSLPLNYLDLLFGSPFKAIVVWKRISRRINGSWQVRGNCTCLKEEGLLPSKACFLLLALYLWCYSNCYVICVFFCSRLRLHI